MSKGIIIFASTADDLELARECSRRVHLYLELPVCIVSSLELSPDQDFEYVRHHPLASEYTKWMAFEMTPFDKTVILDVNYLVMSNQSKIKDLFDQSSLGFIASQGFMTIMGDKIDSLIKSVAHVNSGLMFFERTIFSEKIFQAASAIHENWKFFSSRYSVINSPDAIFSIAVHLVHGQMTPSIPGLYQTPFNTIMLRDVEHDKVRALSDREIFIVYDGVDCKRSVLLSDTDVYVSDKNNLLNMIRMMKDKS